MLRSLKSGKENILVFHGVNLSGGLSLAWTLKRQIGHQSLDIEYHDPGQGFKRNMLEDPSFFSGRKFVFDHGIMHYPLIKENATLFTMVRDPVKRIVSVYYYLLENHPGTLHGLPLEEWIQNYGNFYSQYIQFSNAPKHSTPHDHFAAAVEFLKERIDMLGFCDRMEQAYKRVQSFFGISEDCELLKVESGSNNPYRNKVLPDKLQEHIEKCIPLDIEFHSIANTIQQGMDAS